MKQRIKNILPLKWFKNGKFDAFATNELFGNNGSLRVIVDNFLQGIKKQVPNPQIKYITYPFMESISSAEKHIAEIWGTEFSASGIMIMGYTIIYYNLEAKNDRNHHISFILFNTDGQFLCLGEKSDKKDMIIVNPDVTSEQKKLFVGIGYYTPISAELFINFSEIEDRVLLPKQKLHFQTCRYFNDTDSQIRLYDCTWFTNLIKSGEFKVRGHLRLQPYKEGRKIIWIKDFKKEGYTRKATKLQYELQ